MKTFLKIILLVLISGLLIGCKTYRSIENVTVKNNPELNKIENFKVQLEKVSPEERIQVTLEDGTIHNLIYQSHSQDSLFAKKERKSEINKGEMVSTPKNFSLGEIDKLYVMRTNYLISLGLPVAALTGVIIAISNMNLGIDMSGMFSN